MNKKIALAAISTIIAFGIGITILQNVQSSQKYSEIFYLDATFYQDKKYVEIKFDDSSKKTSSVVLEILGMKQSFQKSFSENHFVIQVPFEGVPPYGWKSMPITLVVEHSEFGKIGIKTEAHNAGEQAPQVIYSKL